MSALQLMKIECAWKGQPPFAKQDFNYHHKLVGPTRADIKPLNILQPEGPSFTVSPPLHCYVVIRDFLSQQPAMLLGAICDAACM